MFYPSRDGVNGKRVPRYPGNGSLGLEWSFKWAKNFLNPTILKFSRNKCFHKQAISAPSRLILNQVRLDIAVYQLTYPRPQGGKEIPVKQAKDVVFSQVLWDTYF